MAVVDTPSRPPPRARLDASGARARPRERGDGRRPGRHRPRPGRSPRRLDQADDGNVGWLAFALVLEAPPSWVTRSCSGPSRSRRRHLRIGLRASTEITLAGHAATRLLASAGAGGIALTAWALKKSGMEARDVAARMTTFMVLLYSVYMGSLLIGGVGLYSGLIPGGGSFAMTIVPAIFGAVVIAIVASRPARPAGRVEAAQLALAGRRRRPRRAAADQARQPRPGRGDHVVGVRHRLPVGVLRGLRRVPRRRRAGDRLLRRHARQHASAPRRRGRRRRRHDRHVRRLRRQPGERDRRGARVPLLRLLAADRTGRRLLRHAAPHDLPLGGRGRRRGTARAQAEQAPARPAAPRPLCHQYS